MCHVRDSPQHGWRFGEVKTCLRKNYGHWVIMQKTKNKHGGLRPGAGRKATGKTRHNLTLRIPDTLRSRLEAEAAECSSTLNSFCIRKLSQPVTDLTLNS